MVDTVLKILVIYSNREISQHRAALSARHKASSPARTFMVSRLFRAASSTKPVIAVDQFKRLTDRSLSGSTTATS